MGHPFHLIRYSISYERINKKWNGRLKTSLGIAAFKEAVSIYFAAFPLRKQSFSQKHFYFSSTESLQIELVTKYDTNGAQKESLVGEFKPTKEGPYPPADMDWEGGGGSKSAKGPNTLWHQRKMSVISGNDLY